MSVACRSNGASTAGVSSRPAQQPRADQRQHPQQQQQQQQ
jgi:hypothetical protein